VNLIEEEILRAAKVERVVLEPLSKAEEANFWAMLSKKTGASLDGPIWTQIEFSFNKNTSNGWRQVGDFFKTWPNLFFCDHYTGIPIFRIKSEDDCQRLLAESFSFVFYVAKEDLSWLFVYDDHECVRFTEL
jgi:hypothetical protein